MIAPEDPQAADVVDLLARHLEFARSQGPPEDAHALEVDGLAAADVDFFALRRDRGLLAVGALTRLEPWHGEIKSMHTATGHRGEGLGASMLAHLLEHARQSQMTRVSLETGSMAIFAPARALYSRAGFVACEPYADYRPSAYSSFFTRTL